MRPVCKKVNKEGGALARGIVGESREERETRDCELASERPGTPVVWFGELRSVVVFFCPR